MRGENTQPSTPSEGFTAQLSSAIAESLQRLGVAPGEINISIKNGGGSASAAQILISYNGISPATEPTAEPVAGSTEPEASEETKRVWSPWHGPRDARDAMPAGDGSVTESGAPAIVCSEEPCANQYNYTGPAARNPYFTTPSNPLRQGYVPGFQEWFTQPFILGAESGPMPANKIRYSTEEGAQEALRIVQQFEPGATLTQTHWQGGRFSASIPMYCVSLPDGRLISAGGILADYYNGGHGVTTASDEFLLQTLQLA